MTTLGNPVILTMRMRRKTNRWRKSVGKRLNEVDDQDDEFRTFGEGTRKGKNDSAADRDGSELHLHTL